MSENLLFNSDADKFEGLVDRIDAEQSKEKSLMKQNQVNRDVKAQEAAYKRQKRRSQKKNSNRFVPFNNFCDKNHFEEYNNNSTDKPQPEKVNNFKNENNESVKFTLFNSDSDECDDLIDWIDAERSEKKLIMKQDQLDRMAKAQEAAYKRQSRRSYKKNSNRFVQPQKVNDFEKENKHQSVEFTLYNSDSDKGEDFVHSIDDQNREKSAILKQNYRNENRQKKKTQSKPIEEAQLINNLNKMIKKIVITNSNEANTINKQTHSNSFKQLKKQTKHSINNEPSDLELRLCRNREAFNMFHGINERLLTPPGFRYPRSRQQSPTSPLKFPTSTTLKKRLLFW